MSSLFGNAKPRLTQYRQLDQLDSDLSESDDDEKVIFRKPGDLELNLYPGYKLKSVRRKARAKAKCRKIGGVVCLLTVTLVVVVALVARSKWSKHVDTKKLCITCDWDITLKDKSVENGLVLLDVDGDGKDDLIFSVVNNDVLSKLLHSAKYFGNGSYADLQSFCQDQGKEYPCAGIVYAVRGHDGKVLWTMRIRSLLLNLNCEAFDIDGDGRKDCIGSGRMGTVVAFNPYKGERFWMTENDQYLVPSWNIYQVQALPDWDGDGVPEVLVANGGDPKKSPEDVKRTSGRLVILSGASGKPMGDKYLEMPNAKETYMSPVLYKQMDNTTQYVLFGSGGETVPGDFMGISLADFCRYTLGENFSSCPPRETLPWNLLEKDTNGVFVILRGHKKGVMVPPVVVDVNKDGTMDIVVSVYDGAVIMYDGKTMKPTWTSNFTDMESYSTPAPGYFDDDDILDFMVHWNTGTWDGHYNGSVSAIISGENGKVLWTTNSVKDIQASGLVIQTNQSGHDFFLYRHVKSFYTKVDERPRRHDTSGNTQQIEEDYVTNCTERNSPNVQEVYVVDRAMMQNPIQVLQLNPIKYYYEPLQSPVNGETDDNSETSAMKGSFHGYLPDHANGDDSHNDDDDDDNSHEDDGGHEDNDDDDSHEGDDGDAGNDDSHVDDNESMKRQGQSKDKESPSKVRKERENMKKSETKWCSFQIPDGTTTGAIGDVDGDGLIDYISIVPYKWNLYDTKYFQESFGISTVIHKVSIEKHIQNGKMTSVHAPMTARLGSTVSDNQQIPAFLPAKQQKWTQYFGSQGNNWYS